MSLVILFRTGIVEANGVSNGLAGTLAVSGSIAQSRGFSEGYSDRLSNPAAYWKLDETSGTRYDRMGHSDLTDINSVGSTTGIINNSALFNGSNSLKVNHNSYIDVTYQSFWLSFWMLSTGTTGILIGKDNVVNRVWAIEWNAGGVNFFIFGPGGNVVSSGATMSTGVLYHVVAWYDIQDLSLHIRVDDSAQYNASPAYVADLNVPLMLGDREVSAYPYTGLIDEVGLWIGFAPKPSEITKLYNSGSGLAYPFGEGAKASIITQGTGSSTSVGSVTGIGSLGVSGVGTATGTSSVTGDGEAAISPYTSADANATGAAMTGVSDPNLISYWKLDEVPNGTPRADSRGTNTLTDSGTGGVLGKIGNCSSFDGGQYHEIASNASLQVTGDFTISLWVQKKSDSALQWIISKWGAGTNAQYGILHDPTNGWRFVIADDTGNTTVSVGSLPMLNTWDHLVCWYDSSDGKIRMRVNDATTYVGSVVTTAPLTTGSNPFVIGAGSPDHTIRFIGYVDEVALWKRKLTASEITYLFNSSSGNTYPFPSPPFPSAGAESSIVIAGSGSSTGAALVSANSSTTSASVASVSGASTVSGNASAIKASNASSAGTSTSAANSSAVRSGTESSTGTGTVLGQAAARWNSVASTSGVGTATAQATNAASTGSDAVAAGTGIVSGQSTSIKGIAVTSSGLSVALGSSQTLSVASSPFSSTGTATVTAQTQAIIRVSVVVSASGTSAVGAFGVALFPATADSLGTSTIVGSVIWIAAAVFNSEGVSVAVSEPLIFVFNYLLDLEHGYSPTQSSLQSVFANGSLAFLKTQSVLQNVRTD